MFHDDGLIDVVVEFAAASPDLEQLRDNLRSCAACLEFHRVVVVRLADADHPGWIRLECRAPDAESVRIVCRRANVIFDRIRVLERSSS